MSKPIYKSSRHDRPHARLYDHHLNHPAWSSLRGNAFKLLCTLLARYRPNKPNSFPAGGATVASLIGVSEKTGKAAVDELLIKGHLREERKGRNKGAVKTRERIVSLTRFDTDSALGDPDFPIKLWKTQKHQQKVPDEPGKKSGFENSSNWQTTNHGLDKNVPPPTSCTHI